MKITRLSYRRERHGRHRHTNVVVVRRGVSGRSYHVTDQKAASLRKTLKNWEPEDRWLAFTGKPYQFTLTLFDVEEG